MFDEAHEDELLLGAMMRLGAKGGAIGGALGGAATGTSGLSGAGAKGGARGAARGMRWTKKDVAQRTLPMSVTVADAPGIVRQALEAAGELVGSEVRDDGSVVLRAMVGVGLGGLNPAIVTAVVVGGPADVASVELRAAGREGLIKQHPADKALAKVAALLSPTA